MFGPSWAVSRCFCESNKYQGPEMDKEAWLGPLTPFPSQPAPRDRCYYSSHFTDVEAEAPGSKQCDRCSCYTANTQQRQAHVYVCARSTSLGPILSRIRDPMPPGVTVTPVSGNSWQLKVPLRAPSLSSLFPATLLCS